MKISQYIIVRRTGNPNWPKYHSRMTQGNPALASNEVAVKVSVELPDEIFDRPALTAEIKVPKEAISKPVITADVVDNVQDIIKQNTGFDVTLEIIGNEEKI